MPRDYPCSTRAVPVQYPCSLIHYSCSSYAVPVQSPCICCVLVVQYPCIYNAVSVQYLCSTCAFCVLCPLTCPFAFCALLPLTLVFPLFLAFVLPAFGCFSLGLSLFPSVLCSLPSLASVPCLPVLSMQIGLLPLNAQNSCILWCDGDHEDFER
jgi:hypothetical protein